MTTTSLYRRPLPERLVPFASDEGRTLFREALAEGHMEGFFALAEQFHTQADPAFCGLASLVVVLNALGVDPGRLWKGPWRWFSEELLDCCAPLERVRERGLAIDEVACLARCNGADARVERHAAGLERLRDDVRAASRSALEPILVASYARSALGQTGSGHFSPIGGFHEARDLVLVLDVARFKYPPHWVPLDRLYDAMKDLDPDTGSPRGWIMFTRRRTPSALLFCVSAKDGVATLLAALETTIPERIAAAAPSDAKTALVAFTRALADVAIPIEARSPLAPEHLAAAEAVLCTLRTTEAYAHVASASASIEPDLATTIALAAPSSVWSRLPENVSADVTRVLAASRSSAPLASEIQQVELQIAALAEIARRRSEV
jgi:glutathione gamma-glutamylcysteinyltransferase